MRYRAIGGNANLDRVYATLGQPFRARTRSGHAHQDIELNLALGGELRYHVGGQDLVVPAGRLVIFSAAAPHTLIRWTATRIGVACIPLGVLLSWRLPPQLRDRLLAGQCHLAALDPDDEARFASWARLMPAQGPAGPGHVAGMLELQARLWRCAERTGDWRLVEQGDEAAQLAAIYLSSHALETISMEDVARSVGRHPKHLARAFRQQYRTSMRDFLQGLRLSHAAALLADGDDPVLEVGLASGYGSQAAFYAAFRKRYGQSPARWRHLRREV